MAQARTINQVQTLARRITGRPVELHKGDGYFYFIHNEEDAEGRTVRHETYSVYTCQLSALSTQQWEDEARAFGSHLDGDE